MSLRKIASVIVLAIVLSIGAGFLHAQTNSGALVGVIRDPSGAVIPNTTVNATNEATGVLYTGVTNANGEYRISNLPEGTYDLRTAIAGFTPAAIKGVAVSSTIVSTKDIVLTIGQGTTTAQCHASRSQPDLLRRSIVHLCLWKRRLPHHPEDDPQSWASL